MTPEQSAALRKPFDAKTIGKLPKGGAQLDYVGHAAVTDRLLAVDPDWSWEPFATDEHGLPAYQSGYLWIRLTVCGVTRIGVGDGPDPKQRIGDAIRNAAMRFGVALDLWSRQELEGTDPNGGDALAGQPDVAAHNTAQEQARAEAAPEPTKEEFLAGFLTHLLAGPQEQTAKGKSQFYARAIAAAARQGVLNEQVEHGGAQISLRELIEVEQLRVGVAA